MQKICYFFLIVFLLSLVIGHHLFAKTTTTSINNQQAITYTVTFISPEVPKLATEMVTHSELIRLANQPLNNKIGLNLRVKEDINIAQKILDSNGYYSGTIQQDINWQANPIKIQIQFKPGVQYKINTIAIQYLDEDLSYLPLSLEKFNLNKEDPALAINIISSVDNLMQYIHNNGYPLAKLEHTQYIINRMVYTLDINLIIKQGPLLHMGEVQPQNKLNISTRFLNKIITWKEGRVWSNALIDSYRTRLQQTGLFSSISLTPSNKKEQNRNTPIELVATEAPPRTISGGVQYSSDQGIGARGTWEHRNVFGNGEFFRLTAPMTQDDQRIMANFRKPAFGSPKQSFISEAQLLKENTTSYKQQLASITAGLERQFNRRLFGSTSFSVDTGFMDDRDSAKKMFTLFGVPLSITRDTSKDPLNPVKGTKTTLKIIPYTGKYKKNILTLRSRLDFSFYLDVLETGKLILASKIAVGSLLGRDIENYPAMLRFYAGGGGSVRGYDYQSLGPKNKYGDAIGGLSFSTISFELRMKITDTIGIVPFIDGGNIYEKKFPDFKKAIYWGVGLGLRYYTSFAPIRLDVATPLQNRRHNKHFQFYISIGQSF